MAFAPLRGWRVLFDRGTSSSGMRLTLPPGSDRARHRSVAAYSFTVGDGRVERGHRSHLRDPVPCRSRSHRPDRHPGLLPVAVTIGLIQDASARKKSLLPNRWRGTV